MTFDQWLAAERGRLKLVAERFGITPSAVSQWRANGVPVAYILEVNKLTKGAVSLESMLRREPAGRAA